MGKRIIELPEKATNGDIILSLFPNCQLEVINEKFYSGPIARVYGLDGSTDFRAEWFFATYKEKEN